MGDFINTIFLAEIRNSLESRKFPRHVAGKCFDRDVACHAECDYRLIRSENTARDVSRANLMEAVTIREMFRDDNRIS